MEKIPQEVCGLNSLRCIAASKVPLNINPSSTPFPVRMVLRNLASEFIDTISDIKSQLTKIREEYFTVFDRYNTFVLRSEFIEDKDNLYEDFRFHDIGMTMAYNNLPQDAPENCEWFGYIEYLKFNVFVGAREFSQLFNTPHALYTMAKGIVNSVPDEPTCEMPEYMYDLYRGCTMYIRMMKNLVARYESMYSWEISKKKQSEYGQYLYEYDAKKKILNLKLEENEEALSTCILYGYDEPFEDMSLDEILEFDEDVEMIFIENPFIDEVNVALDETLFF